MEEGLDQRINQLEKSLGTHVAVDDVRHANTATEIIAIKEELKDISKMNERLVLLFLSSVVSAVVTWFVTRGTAP